MAKLKLKERNEQKEKLVDSIVDSIGSAPKESKSKAEVSPFAADVGEIAEVLNITEVEERDGDSTALALRDETAGSGENALALAEELPVRKIRYSLVAIAAALIFFAVVGIVSSVGFVIRTVDDISTRRTLREEMALFVFPVVINDPPSFDNVAQLQDSTMIACAIWQIMLTGDLELYASDDVGVIYIPEADVERAANSLFGLGGLNHQTVRSDRAEFIHSPENRRYQVPEMMPQPAFYPVVTSVTNVGEVYTVTVDYMLPNPFAMVGIERENEPIKTMIYIITRTSERMMIDSIQVGEFVA
jgi:hypothetical protein